MQANTSTNLKARLNNRFGTIPVRYMHCYVAIPEFLDQRLMSKKRDILRVIISLAVSFDLLLWLSREDALEDA